MLADGLGQRTAASVVVVTSNEAGKEAPGIGHTLFPGQRSSPSWFHPPQAWDRHRSCCSPTLMSNWFAVSSGTKKFAGSSASLQIEGFELPTLPLWTPRCHRLPRQPWSEPSARKPLIRHGSGSPKVPARTPGHRFRYGARRAGSRSGWTRGAQPFMGIDCLRVATPKTPCFAIAAVPRRWPNGLRKYPASIGFAETPSPPCF